MSEFSDDTETIAIVGIAAIAAWLLFKIVNNIRRAEQQGEDWLLGDAVYNAQGQRVPLSPAAQQALNAGNILPTDVQTDQNGQTTVKVLDVTTGGTLYIDPNTGMAVS